MAWRIVRRVATTSNDPLIIVHKQRFSYNILFYRLAELEKNQYVTYYVDEENRKIGFEFGNQETEHTSKIVGSNKQGYVSYSTELFRQPWIKKAGEMKEQNKYKPTRDGKKWVITLRPIFENRIKRENIEKLGSNVKGIYRYLDNGQVVYIGKGFIRKRLNEEQRKNWKFDAIEYSIINDDDEQYEWESYWIDEFKRVNDNFLPPYNIISGHTHNGD
jgi:hypothetical protein